MRIAKIKDNDVANGLGVSMSVWTQGCPHHCKGCFNMNTWSYDEGREFTDDDLNYIIKNINKHVERNLSILGGEPLCPENVEGVINLCKTIREIYPSKKIYLWTGYTFEEFNSTQKEVLKYVDTIVDGKFEIDKRDLGLLLRGSSNQRIINISGENYDIYKD